MVLGQNLLLFIATSLVEAHKLILCIICLCTTSTIKGMQTVCSLKKYCKLYNYYKNYKNDNIIF